MEIYDQETASQSTNSIVPSQEDDMIPLERKAPNYDTQGALYLSTMRPASSTYAIRSLFELEKHS